MSLREPCLSASVWSGDGEQRVLALPLRTIGARFMSMITRSSLLHLRLPFSYFLLPVYLLALLAAGPVDGLKAGLVFFVLHFLLYPAANGFNSYYDRDQESIGVLRHPPPVTRDLLWLSLALDAAALIVALGVGWPLVAGCLLYSVASKAYSWNRIRLKQFPFLSWMLVGCCQGPFTFLVVLVSVQKLSCVILPGSAIPAAVSGLYVLGFFPLTQVYQHWEDSKRGVETISLRLGVRGTFCLSALFMAAAALIYYAYLHSFVGAGLALGFAASSIPALVYFVHWFLAVAKDEAKADYGRAMRMCVLASTGLNLFSLAALVLAGRG